MAVTDPDAVTLRVPDCAVDSPESDAYAYCFPVPAEERLVQEKEWTLSSCHEKDRPAARSPNDQVVSSTVRRVPTASEPMPFCVKVTVAVPCTTERENELDEVTCEESGM